MTSNMPKFLSDGSVLPDIQKAQDTRGIEIDQVGVSNVRYPLTLRLRDSGEFNTVGVTFYS